MKVMTVVGTRPEIIRLSRVLAHLDQTVDHVLVHTGQNYDPLLNEVFFNDLKLRAPDHQLGVETTSLGTVLGQTFIRTEQVITQERPDALLVLGDTNSCLSAIMAKRMQVPVYHMEAGNRCFDENVPEEVNRKLVDHVADFNLVYTEHARRNLLAEGLHPRRIMVTGSPMNEVLTHYRHDIDSSSVVERLGLVPEQYVLVSAHREENVDSPEQLRILLECLNAVADKYAMTALVSTHPRTRKRLTELGQQSHPLITWHEPFGFLDYNKLQMQAFCVLSDSGTIAEESTILGFPAITLRESIERPEALESGGIVMTGLKSREVIAGIDRVRSVWHDRRGQPAFLPADYAITDTSHRVVSAMLSTAPMHHAWAGIRRHEK